MSFVISQRFLPLFITQFFGAFNDNLLKNSLVILITYRIAIETGDNAQMLVTIAAGLFILPFFFFSATAGQLADKYDRAKITRIIKIIEIIIMLTAALGFITHNHYFLIAVVFAAGMHSTFFGPIKYALLPQHLKPNELLAGNAYIEAGTFLAILFGTISGGILILKLNGEWLVSIGLITVAIIGYISSIYIPPAPGPAPELKLNHNIWQATRHIINYSRIDHRVFIAILAISWFWLLGATFLSQFPNYVKHTLHAEAKIVTIFLTLFSIGIAIGSFLCNKLLRGSIKTTYVAISALGISIFTCDLYFASQDMIFFNVPALFSVQSFIHLNASWRIMADILLIAICAGVYIVPLYALVQKESADVYRARIMAANNVMNALFMVISAGYTMIFLSLGRAIPEVFLSISLINLLVAFHFYTTRS